MLYKFIPVLVVSSLASSICQGQCLQLHQLPPGAASRDQQSAMPSCRVRDRAGLSWPRRQQQRSEASHHRRTCRQQCRRIGTREASAANLPGPPKTRNGPRPRCVVPMPPCDAPNKSSWVIDQSSGNLTFIGPKQEAPYRVVYRGVVFQRQDLNSLGVGAHHATR